MRKAFAARNICGGYKAARSTPSRGRLEASVATTAACSLAPLFRGERVGVRGEALRLPRIAALRVGGTDPRFCNRIFRTASPLTRSLRYAPASTSPREEERGEVK